MSETAPTETAETPAVTLLKTIAAGPALKAAMVITIDADERMSVAWSEMPMAVLAMTSLVVAERVRGALFQVATPPMPG